MASTDEELELQLKEAGSMLIDPPTSAEELLPILDQVESYLLKVEQSPSSTMQEALSPSLHALVDDKLLRHSNLDVKAAVASCISEITRITAPDAPYNDGQMKEVFQLIVSSFENLSDQSSRSYMKRTSILETVAKVRSCVVMLDLECDALIIEMFQHFLNSIRDYHPKNVFSSMETIMTLVLEESEDIPPEFLSPILESVKNNNKEVLPIARKLGERVLESCANKVRQYLSHAVKTLGLSVDNYSEIVASICQEARDGIGQNDVSAADQVVDETNTGMLSSEEAENANQGEEETAKESTALQVGPTNHNCSKYMINGNVRAGEDCLEGSHSLKKQEDRDFPDQVEGITESRNDDPDNLNGSPRGKKLKECTEEEGRKSSSSNSAASSDRPVLDKETESEKPTDSKVDNKDVGSLLLKESTVNAAVLEGNNKDAGINISSSKLENGESELIASLSPGENPTGENCTESGQAERKEDSIKEAAEASRKISDQTSDSEVKPSKPLVKKAPDNSSDDIKTPNTAQSSRKASVVSESKTKKQTSKTVDVGIKSGLTSKQSQEREKHSQANITSEKRISKSYGNEDNKVPSPKSKKSTKDTHHSGETPKTNMKRKHPSGTETESKSKELGEEVVGLKIKVWWPKDKMFYKGVVDSFDPAKKKHKIAYVDGDIEILNLKKEKYQLLGDDSNANKEEESDSANTDTSSDLPLKKKGELTVAHELNKQVKTVASPKSAEGTASKSKCASSKASSKSKDSSKVVAKSKEPKCVNKSKEDVGGKTKDQASKSGSGNKTKDGYASKSSKLKDGSLSTPSVPVKSQQETPRTGKTKETPTAASMSKGKSTKTGGKSDANGTGNVKANLSKKREREAMNGSPHSNTKGKSPNVSKAQPSEGKTGKKRRRT